MADTGSSAVAVVGDPNLGCLRYLDTSDRCDTNRHVECLYGSGGWRGVDCHREVAVQAAHRAPHWQALHTGAETSSAAWRCGPAQPRQAGGPRTAAALPRRLPPRCVGQAQSVSGSLGVPVRGCVGEKAAAGLLCMCFFLCVTLRISDGL